MIRAGVLLGSALLALSGCASSARRPVTVGAQVVPTRTGFEFYRRGSVNTWHVYDYDGTSRVLTLEDPLGSFGAAVRQFNACVCSQCQALPSAYSASDPGSTRARPPELLKHQTGEIECLRSIASWIPQHDAALELTFPDTLLPGSSLSGSRRACHWLAEIAHTQATAIVRVEPVAVSRGIIT
jgi:hypothetical protein